jgi:hypothetical protein
MKADADAPKNKRPKLDHEHQIDTYDLGINDDVALPLSPRSFCSLFLDEDDRETNRESASTPGEVAEDDPQRCLDDMDIDLEGDEREMSRAQLQYSAVVRMSVDNTMIRPFWPSEMGFVSKLLKDMNTPINSRLWLRDQDITLRFFETPSELGLVHEDIIVCSSDEPWVSVSVYTNIMCKQYTDIRVSFRPDAQDLASVLRRSVHHQLFPNAKSFRAAFRTTKENIKCGPSANDLGIVCGDKIICDKPNVPNTRPPLHQRVTFHHRTPCYQCPTKEAVQVRLRVYGDPTDIKRLRFYKMTFDLGHVNEGMRIKREALGRFANGSASLVATLFNQVGLQNHPQLLSDFVPPPRRCRGDRQRQHDVQGREGQCH